MILPILVARTFRALTGAFSAVHLALPFLILALHRHTGTMERQQPQWTALAVVSQWPDRCYHGGQAGVAFAFLVSALKSGDGPTAAEAHGGGDLSASPRCGR